MHRNKLINTILCLFILIPVAFAQQKQPAAKPAAKKDEKKESKYTYPLLNGLIVGVDLYSPVANLFGQDYGNYEASVELDLYNRFLPVWEVGIGRAKSTPEDQNYTYTGKPALYNRIGMNYNIKFKSTSPDYFFIGLRYGFSSFHYDVTNISIESPYWENTYEGLSITDQKSRAQWIEALGGIRVKLYKGLMMGWTVRYKWLLSYKKNDFSSPWFIPGYGNRGSSLGFTYTIYYKFPLGKKTDNKIIPALKK